MALRYVTACIAGLLVLAGGVAHATASNKELEARAEEMDGRLRAVERASQGLVRLQQQIEAARQELRSLRGQIEESRHELESLQQQQRDLYGDLDRRMLLLENAGGTSTPAAAGAAAASAGAAPTQADILAADETTVYADAFAALKAGRYDEAIRGFQLYLAKYPQGPRADNATYWLGEAHYVTKDYEAALKAFSAVLERFPESRKAPDALLKVGYSQYELEAFGNARSTLGKVVASYPGTDAARLAEQRLTKMDSEQR